MNQFEEVLTQTLKELAEHERNNPQWDSNIIPAYDTLIASHNAELVRVLEGLKAQAIEAETSMFGDPEQVVIVDRIDEAIKKYGGGK